MIFLQLFWSFFQIGLFSIGGGYAALPLIQEQVVELNGWLTMEQFTDLITISQMTPGPIAINAATFVGTQVAGLPGAIICTFANVLPSCIIVMILAYLYKRFKQLPVVQQFLSGLRPAVVALIASAGISILLLTIFKSGVISFALSDIDIIASSVFIVALFVLRKFKPSPILVMAGSGLVGGALYLLL